MVRVICFREGRVQLVLPVESALRLVEILEDVLSWHLYLLSYLLVLIDIVGAVIGVLVLEVGRGLSALVA